MSRSRPVEGPSISLFPFLAVLLCTMGALLVLLVLFSRAAERGETPEQVRAREQAVEELRLAKETLAWRLEQLKGIRAKTAEDLAKARMQLAGIEEHARALTDELDQLEQTAATLAAPAPTDPAESAELEALEARLKNARESLDEKRKELATKPAAYAVVPYVGPAGTHRRPLYIECCIDGVFLQPEGIRLSPGDFEGPPGPGNPLASALRAAREHIARTSQAAGDPAVQPYPLLLVRPSGVMAYYAAREAIQSWGSEFGYQLIDEDWTLTFPPRDPLLADVEKRAIDESRQRLEWFVKNRPTKPARPVTQYRAATTRGGVVANGGPSVLGDQSRWEWGRQQAGRGFGAGGDGDAPGTGDGGRGADPLAAGGPGEEAGGAGGSGGGSGRGDGAAIDGAAVADVEATGERGASGIGVDADGSADGRYPAGSAFSKASLSGGAADGAGSAGDIAGSAAGRDEGVAGGSPGGSVGAAGGSASGSAMASASGAGAGGGSSGPALPGMLQTGGISTAGGSSGASMAQSRGKNWASLATADRPIPLTRPIHVECCLDELRILDDSARRVQARIPLGPDTAAAIDPLVKTVHSRVADWGLAGERMYWKPQLILSATADGGSRRDDIERLLADSGLDTSRKGDTDAIRRLPPVQRASAMITKP